MSTPPPAAGWHPDPFGRHEHRYSDGARWTASVADAGVLATDPLRAGEGVPPPMAHIASPEVKARAPKLAFQSPVIIWGVVSAVLLAVGSVGTWATVGPFTISGTSSGRDGIITLTLAGIAALLIGLRIARWGVLVAGVLALATTVYDIIDITSTGDGLVSASPGWGLILAAVAAASLCVWAFAAKPPAAA